MRRFSRVLALCIYCASVKSDADMGRSVCAEEKIEKTVDSFYKEPWTIGLLIGQLTSQKDYVIHLARTPSKDDDVTQQMKDDTAEKKSKKHTTLETVDEQWVAIHASQVIRMLPGGLDVVGVFAVGSPDMMNKAQAKLRQVLFATHKTLCHGQRTPKPVSSGITDRILLQICSVSRKLTCRTFDVADPKCSARPADWKYQTFLDRWQRLDSTMSIDWVIPVEESALCDTLSNQIQNGLMGYCENVWNSLATIDGRILPAEAVLNQSSQSTSTQHTGKRRRQKVEQTTAASPQRYTVALFAQMSDCIGVTKATIVECGAQMLVRGNISSRAFVHGKATVAEATLAIKTDIVRSLTSRCQLLCEDLLQTEEDQDPKVLYETPIRVFAPVPDVPLFLCDYMFQDEVTTDSMDRFRELLDLVIEPDDIQLDAERIPSEEDLAKSEEFDVESVDDNTDPTSTRNLSRIGLVVSGAVACLAAGMSYVYMGGE